MKKIILTISITALLMLVALNYLGTPRRMDSPGVSQWRPAIVNVATSSSPATWTTVMSLV